MLLLVKNRKGPIRVLRVASVQEVLDDSATSITFMLLLDFQIMTSIVWWPVV